MLNVEQKMRPVIIETWNHLKITQKIPEPPTRTYQTSTKSINYARQPHWALHTYCGKY